MSKETFDQTLSNKLTHIKNPQDIGFFWFQHNNLLTELVLHYNGNIPSALHISHVSSDNVATEEKPNAVFEEQHTRRNGRLSQNFNRESNNGLTPYQVLERRLLTKPSDIFNNAMLSFSDYVITDVMNRHVRRDEPIKTIAETNYKKMGEIKTLINKGRIEFWKVLHKTEYLDMPQLSDYLFHFPALDLQSFEEAFYDASDTLDPQIVQVMNVFFGFDSEKNDRFNYDRVAQITGMRDEESILHTVLQGMNTMME